MATETVSVRMDSTDLREIDTLAKFGKQSKSDILRDVLGRGIQDKKLEIALQKFQQNEYSAWKAARFSALPLTQFLDILRQRRIEFHYTAKELEEDVADLL
jgi:predicted HTH domain antitoxin